MFLNVGLIVHAPLCRLSVAEDTFPESREADPTKTQVNLTLLRLSAALPNRRALVLDGAGCQSARALQQQPPPSPSQGAVAAQRVAADVVVPNAVSETYSKIVELGVCQAFHGSLL